MQSKYQYNLYGLFGEFMGITVSLKEAKIHRAKSDVYYYRRYAFDANDPDWQRAKDRKLICNQGKELTR